MADLDDTRALVHGQADAENASWESNLQPAVEQRAMLHLLKALREAPNGAQSMAAIGLGEGILHGRIIHSVHRALAFPSVKEVIRTILVPASNQINT